jgi:leucyl/phenylalanyl-tRNA--protein transferase
MKRLRLPWLDAAADAPFPPPHLALQEPNGLLCAGGDLSIERLLHAYPLGIFPWYMQGEPILWWCPDPRCVFRVDTLRGSARMRRWWRKSAWTIVFDHDFAAVLDGCAEPRRDGGDTWITHEMREAYVNLHHAGYAHSVEVRDAGRLVGGLYGVTVGQVFFAESMFSRADNASKTALVGLAHVLRAWGWPLIDAQVASPHVMRLGAQMLPRGRFLNEIRVSCAQTGIAGSWQTRIPAFSARELGNSAENTITAL